MLGREAETRALVEALDRVASGASAIVLIEGEAGIGKTRLLQDALQDARARGMQVVAGRAEELERTRPFGLLAAAFGCAPSSPDPRRAAIAALLATHGPGDQGPITVTSDPGLQFRTVDAFGDLAEELALSGPLVIGVDDLQWADPSSLLTLATVNRRLAYLQVALIGCLRPAPRVADLDRLCGALEAVGARRLALGPLADSAVQELVADTIAAEPGPGLLTEIAGAAGNPLFVTELLGALVQEGAIETAGGRAEVAEAILPPTLRLTILRRLSFLPDDTLQALQTASILGSAFSLIDLATVADRTALGLTTALTEAIRTGVLRDDGTQLRFRHDLIRDAIYEDLPGSIRRALHREAGQRLAHAHAPALLVAEHLARGAGAADAEAIGWLTRAAREAAATAPDVAADLLGRAIGLMDPADPGRDRLLAEQASSLMWAGHITAAKQMCRTLLERPHAREAEGPARLCLGYALVAQSQQREALPELERAAVSPALTDAERAGARAWAGYARLSMADLDGASATASEALSAAPADHLATSVALATHALVAVHRRHPADALEMIDEAVSLADQSPDRQGHRFPIHATRGFILTELDRLDEASSTLDIGKRISEELGIRWHLPNYQILSAVTRYIAGEWDDAITEVEATQELVDETGESYSLILGHCVVSLICVHRNELSRAEEAARAAVGALGEPGPRYRALWAMWAHAFLLEADGQSAAAFALLDECWDRCAQSGLTLDYRAFGPDLVRLALANGESDRARSVAAAITEIAEQNQVASLAGAALRCRGLAEDDPEILRAAVAAYASGSRPLELALASEEAGAAFARQGMVDQVRPLLEQAIELYERLGAARDLARAEAVLRQAGIHRGRRGPRGRPRTGWPSLTPTERSVAELVTEGLSNPQIGDRLYISRRTVQTHLAHVFAKLDLTSRAQLAAVVTQHRSDQP
jgi:DNA-binding CsgD family transcriptional regulator/tetratricopeptide (TPR) repeat protein